jgi:hypothetical protein
MPRGSRKANSTVLATSRGFYNCMKLAGNELAFGRMTRIGKILICIPRLGDIFSLLHQLFQGRVMWYVARGEYCKKIEHECLAVNTVVRGECSDMLFYLIGL